jgi:hypothetical protein
MLRHAAPPYGPNTPSIELCAMEATTTHIYENLSLFTQLPIAIRTFCPRFWLMFRSTAYVNISVTRHSPYLSE